MAIKYYELKVKKLVNFAGVEYALMSDVALKLSKSQLTSYTGTNLGSYETWNAEGLAEISYVVGDVITIGGVGYICNAKGGASIQDNFISLKDGVVTLEDYISHADDENIHITAEERTAWNSKVGSIEAGDNISITDNGDGSFTIAGTYEYTLPAAEEEVLGGIKLGDGLEKVYDGENYTGEVEAVAKTKSDISVSKAIGYLKIGDTISAGTTLDDFLAALLQTYVTPVLNSVSIEPAGPVEIGETINVTKVSYAFDSSYAAYKKYLTPGSVKFYDGSITSGTNITANGTVGANNEAVIPNSGSLKLSSAIPLTNSSATSHSFSVSCGYTKEDGSAGTVSKSGSVSWQQAYFYGVLKNDELPSDDTIRTLLTKKLNPQLKTKFTLTANDGDKIVCFVYPKSVHGASNDQTASSILALDSMSSEVKTAFTYVDRTVKLADKDGTEVAYTMAYLMPSGGFTQQARYEIYI